MASLVLRPAVGCLDSPTPLQRHEGTQTTHLRTFNSSRERKQLYQILPPSSSSSSSSSPMVVRAVTTGLVGDSSSDSYESNEEIKEALFQALKGIDRGIFGVTSAKRSEIMELVELLESRNPTPQPTDNLLDKVNGCWKLVYTTITILGAKRTKLGLRDFISLGDFEQTIDVAKEKAFNVIKFNVRGFNLFNGKLTIEASYKIASKKRVDIKLENSSITPDQLMNLFQKNYDLLLAIFNPEGWLDITYVDDTLRIGRDDKNNIFILERAEQEA